MFLGALGGAVGVGGSASLVFLGGGDDLRRVFDGVDGELLAMVNQICL